MPSQYSINEALSDERKLYKNSFHFENPEQLIQVKKHSYMQHVLFALNMKPHKMILIYKVILAEHVLPFLIIRGTFQL